MTRVVPANPMVLPFPIFAGTGNVGIGGGGPLSLDLTAKRWDGSGSQGVFSGVIPFQVGQVSNTSELNSISIFDGVTELPITVEDMELRHLDGSIKSARVHTQLTLANQTLKTGLSLKINQAPTAGSVTAATINKAWMDAPRLLACSDAEHLCKSRVALGPLLSEATLRAQGLTKIADCLTTEFDSLTTTFPTGGKPKDYYERGDINAWWTGGAASAQYNCLYAMYCRYLISGDIDWLRATNGIASRETVGWQYKMSQHGHADEYMEYADTGSPWTVNLDYPNPPNNGQYAMPETASEWASGWARDCYMVWACSGWEQAKRYGVTYAHRNLADIDVYTNASPWFCRFDFRAIREHLVMLPLYNMSDRLQYNNTPPPYYTGGYTEISEPASNTAWWANIFQTKYFDRFQTWSETMPGGDARYGIWGHHNRAATGNTYSDGTPIFQFALVYNLIYELQMNVYQDTGNRVFSQIEKMADWLIDNKFGGPFDVSAISGFGPVDEVYNCSYLTVDPTPTVRGTQNTLYSPAMLIPTIACAYAYARDEGLPQATIDKYRNFVDSEFSHYIWQYADGVSGSAGNHWKQLGEFYEMLFHAAAHRAGVRYDGWEL